MTNSPASRPRTKASTKPSVKAKGIFLLGMHRSGTSAITRVLNLLGCALPENLLGPGDGNETGHWESEAVVILNDQIFAAAGSRWDDWGPLNEDWHQSSLRDDMLHQAVSLVDDHVQLGSPFVIKDPRLCRLADLWLAAAEEAKVEPLVILMVRNPVEVIASLETRDLMAPGYAQLLWLRHVLDSEFYSRGSKRMVARYDQLLNDWFSVINRVRTDLGVALPRNSTAVQIEIDQFLAKQHLHHAFPLEAVASNPALSNWLRRTFAIMKRWSEEGEKASDYSELDKIRHEFDQSYSTFARLLIPQDLNGDAGLGPRLKRQLADQIEEAQTQSADAEARLSAAAARARELEEAVAQIHAEKSDAQSQMEQEVRHRQEIEARLEEAQNMALEAQTQSADAEARLSAAAARARELEEAVAQIHAEKSDAQSQMEQEVRHRQEIEARLEEAQNMALEAQTQSADAEARLSAAAARARELEEEVAQIHAEKSDAQSQMEQEVRHRQEIEAELVEAQAEVHRMKVLNAELAGKLTVSSSTLSQRQEELSQLLDRLLETERKLAQAFIKDQLVSEQLAEAKAAAEAARLAASDVAGNALAERQKTASIIDQLNSELAAAEQGRQKVEQQARSFEEAKNRAEAAVESYKARATRLELEFRKEQSARAAAEASGAQSEQKLKDRFSELATLTKILDRESRKNELAIANHQWLCETLRLTESFPKWWGVLPERLKRRLEHARYAEAGLFDAQAYLESYPDVASHGMDPLRHFIMHGMEEGREVPHSST